jgi:hypothetical protein
MAHASGTTMSQKISLRGALTAPHKLAALGRHSGTLAQASVFPLTARVVLAIIVPVLAASRPSLILDPLIAEARELRRKRRALLASYAAATLILGAALAGAAFLQYHQYGRTLTPLLSIVHVTVHPWWVYTATVALCMLGIAGAAAVLGKAHRAVAIGRTTAGVLFLAAGIGAIADTGLEILNNYGVLGHTNLGAAFLLLALMCGALTRTFWPRLPRSARPRT